MSKESRNPPRYFPLVATLFFLAFVIAAVFEKEKPPAPTASAPEAVARPLAPVAGGGRFYYFPFLGDQLDPALTAFYAEYPTLRCVHQGTAEEFPRPRDANPLFSHVTGHILHCRDTATPAQNMTVP